MAASMESYEAWLTKYLLSLNPDADTDVFVSYITGILDEDSPLDERQESLQEILGQILEDKVEQACEELFKKWDEMSGVKAETKSDHAGELTDHLASILEQQKIETVKAKPLTKEEQARKKAILEQYGGVGSDEEEDDTSDPGGDGGGDDLLDFKNSNAETVKNRELETREKSKLESAVKKEKDKHDREAQKDKVKDRKEAEKKRTQKGEKRR